MEKNGPDNVIRSYKDLVAWQEARFLVKAVYLATRCFPADELYGLTQQIRRAAVSVPSNIAEGYGRGSRNEYIHFLQTARGSLYEVQTQLILAEDLAYLPHDTLRKLHASAERCSKLLHGLLRSLCDDR